MLATIGGGAIAVRAREFLLKLKPSDIAPITIQLALRVRGKGQVEY